MPVSSPRRRCVGATVTIVIPSAGTVPPPGTVSSNGTLRRLPTALPRSNAPQVRCRSGFTWSIQNDAIAASRLAGARKDVLTVRRKSAASSGSGWRISTGTVRR